MAARTYIVGRLRSAHHSRDMILRLSFLKRNNMSFDLFAVYDQLFNAFLYTVRVLDVDVVAGAAEGTCKTEVAEALRDARIDTETIVLRLYAQDRLRDIHEGPCGGSGQPAVFCLSEEFGIRTGYHLRVDIRLGSVDLADVLNVGRAGLFIDIKGAGAMSDNGLCD